MHKDARRGIAQHAASEASSMRVVLHAVLGDITELNVKPL
jgi:hypothetical protein